MGSLNKLAFKLKENISRHNRSSLFFPLEIQMLLCILQQTSQRLFRRPIKFPAHLVIFRIRRRKFKKNVGKLVGSYKVECFSICFSLGVTMTGKVEYLLERLLSTIKRHDNVFFWTGMRKGRQGFF